MMEEALIAKLLATSGISSIVSTRVYPGSLPQGGPRPAITVNRISGAPLYADDGEVGLEDARVQVDCWADTYTGAKLLARAVRDCLSAFAGSVSGVNFRNIMVDAERDLREGGGNSAEYPFRVSLDFIVWFYN